MSQAIANAESGQELDADEEIDDERAAELAAIRTEVLAKHWDEWVDVPLPALDGKTPRQAAKSALGRERLEALFAEFTWRNETQPTHLRVDVATLRQKLKLPGK